MLLSPFGTRRLLSFCFFNSIFILLNLYLWTYTPREQHRNTDEYLIPKDSSSTSQHLEPHEGPRSSDSRPKLEKLHWKGSRLSVDSLPVSDAFQEGTKAKTLRYAWSGNRGDYKQYNVPPIESTKLVNCAAILDGDPNELEKANKTMKNIPKVPIYEETYLEWTKDCDKFKQDRGYVQVPLSKDEVEFPLAFSIAMYTDVEQSERLLRAIYQPQNLYCFHVDIKSSLLLHRTVRAIAACFHNVWVATHLDKIKWGDISVILSEINCMRDLLKYYRGKFKYFINLTGQEFPLRTNLELIRIARIFNGSNDIAGSISRVDRERVDFKWTHRWSKTYQQTIFYNTFIPKEPYPLNLTFFKGELHALFSHGMVEFIIESEHGKRYLEWCWNTGHPSEHYWNTLNYNTHLAAPGGYDGPLEIADKYSTHPVVRAKNWIGMYDDWECHGKEQRGICVYGLEDTPWLAKRNELFANKFQLTYQYLAIDCLEERHRNRTSHPHLAPFNEQFYRSLPTVVYGRKDGLPKQTTSS